MPSSPVELRMLTVMPRPIYPPDTGGKIRTSKLFERLARKHHITILCFRTSEDRSDQFEQMRACCERLETVDWHEAPKFSPRFHASLAASLLSSLPFTVWKYRSAPMRNRIEALLATGAYDLLLCDFLQPSINCVDAAYRPKVLFQHNVEAVIRLRHAAHATNPVARAYLGLEAKKLERYERRAALAFDHCIMVSEADCRTMAANYGATNTSAIPTGVDDQYFHPEPCESPDPTMVFVGSMDWLPNQDAAQYLVSEILPLIRREVSAAQLVIVGRNPPESIRTLARIPGVQVTGMVEDVRPFVANAQVCVVPIRIGGGTRIKIFEALAMEKAVVSTTVGAEGLPVTHRQDILLADEAETFAAEVVRTFRDVELRRALGRAGRALVSERFSWEAAATEFSRICSDVVCRNEALRS